METVRLKEAETKQDKTVGEFPVLSVRVKTVEGTAGTRRSAGEGGDRDSERSVLERERRYNRCDVTALMNILSQDEPRKACLLR